MNELSLKARAITRLSPARLPLTPNDVQRAPTHTGLWYFLQLWRQLR
jgi:hypothetical protein